MLKIVKQTLLWSIIILKAFLAFSLERFETNNSINIVIQLKQRIIDQFEE